MGTRFEAIRASAAAVWEGALEKWARPSPLRRGFEILALYISRGWGWRNVMLKRCLEGFRMDGEDVLA